MSVKRFVIKNQSGVAVNTILATDESILSVTPEAHTYEHSPVPVEVKEAIEAHSVREKRRKALLDSDWTQVSDSTADKMSWALYRKELRGITKQAGFPFAVVWPEEPS